MPGIFSSAVRIGRPTDVALTQTTGRVRFGIRGIGGEIGTTLTHIFFAIPRGKFEAFKQVTGGSITALIRLKDGMTLNDTIRADRSYLKLNNLGTLEENTYSPYAYAKQIRDVRFDDAVEGRVHITGQDGRVLTVDYVAVPDRVANLDVLARLDLLVEATGEGFKKAKTPGEGYDLNLYKMYPALNVIFSAPVKAVPNVPHHLNGVNDVKAGKENATGSCSTHAGGDLIHSIRSVITRALKLEEGELIIEGGLFDSTHSLTPTDLKTLKFYTGATVIQTTGFGSAMKVVYPVPDIQNIKASTRRYNSFAHLGDTHANGISTFSLSMTISVKRGKGEVTADMIKDGLREVSMDTEGRNHIGIIHPSFAADTNKKTGIFTGISLTGMVPTVMLPLNDNIEVVKTRGVKIIDGVEYDVYVVTIQNAGYDNRLGFGTDFLAETSNVSHQRLGRELIPGFSPVADIGNSLAFVETGIGRDMFREALKHTDGTLLLRVA